VLERDLHVAEWIRLTEERLPQVVSVSPGGGRGHEGGVRAAARELGVNREDARRAAKVASLPEEAKDTAREVGLDNNRAALLAAGRTADPAAELRRLRAEKDAAEAAKRDRNADRTVRRDAAEAAGRRAAKREPATDPQRSYDPPVSLAPLTVEQALSGLFKVPAPAEPKRRPEKAGRKA
jgi:hypothetical protein